LRFFLGGAGVFEGASTTACVFAGAFLLAFFDFLVRFLATFFFGGGLAAAFFS
jgi:hypothetical protein